MESHTISTAVKLEGQKNWSTWKFQVSVTLKGAELFGVVDGTEQKTEANQIEWSKKDAKAQSVIVSRLSETVMVHVLTCETAKDMWFKLKAVYEPKSATSTLMLQQRFLQYKYEGGDLSVFLSKLQEMKCQLKQGGEEVSDKFLMTKVLMSLPENYSHFISAWESVETIRQNYDDLVARLLVEEERIKARDTEEEKNVAMYVRGNNYMKPGSSQRKCFKCGKIGHFAQACKSNNAENRKCFVCGKAGHLKLDCPRLQNKFHQQNHLKFGNSSHNNALTATTVTAMTSGNEGGQLLGDKWVIDSGASEHMTFNRSLLSKYQTMSDRFVVVGDGRRLPVVGVGEVELEVFNGDSLIKSTMSNVLYVPDMKINLFSVPKLTRKGFVVTMYDDRCLFYKRDLLCGLGRRQGNYYVLESQNREKKMVEFKRDSALLKEKRYFKENRNQEDRQTCKKQSDTEYVILLEDYLYDVGNNHEVVIEHHVETEQDDELHLDDGDGYQSASEQVAGQDHVTDDQEGGTSSESVVEETRTRSGRQIKKPLRYDVSLLVRGEPSKESKVENVPEGAPAVSPKCLFKKKRRRYKVMEGVQFTKF